MLLAGKTPAQAAQAVGVARQTAYTWKAVLDEGGIDALRAMPTRGRPARLDDEQLQALGRALLQSPTAHGFGTELWTLKRVGVLIKRCTASSSARRKSGASSAAWDSRHKSPSAARSSATKSAVQTWKRKTWPGLKKKPSAKGRLIVFIDESGLSERPTRVRTWAPKGQTPVIQFHFNWTHISVIAGLSRTNCLFRMYEGSIKKEQHVEFLKALRAHLKQPLLIIWDGLKAHRSALVREYLDSTDGEVQMAFLPPYSPDLNPGGVPVGLAQASCLGQLLPGQSRRTQRHRPQQAQERSASPVDHRRVLGPGWLVVMS